MWYFCRVNLLQIFELNDHKTYIKRCISLAKNGLGTTYPNPLVGSVIVHNNKIIGEGWHYQSGKPHAEVNAINSVKNESHLKEATIYVSLEPCSHFGKTPPCSDLIISKGIPNVVIGCVDSYSEVSGSGIKRLQEHGCNVTVGVLEQECLDLNKRFFSFHNKKRPYIFLKWAETQDGFIAPEHNSEITWISNSYSKQWVHKLRAEEQAILVGTQTAIIDNPKLDVRSWNGSNPVRVVIDRDLKIPETNHIYRSSTKTIVLCEETKEDDNIYFEKIDFKNLANETMRVLYKHGIQSIIIEGGAKTLDTFIEANLWDEAFVFVGASIFGSGISAPILQESFSTKNISEDLLKHYTNA